MQLTQNFTLAEMLKSQMAERLKIDNTPSRDAIENLKEIAANILQPVRDHFSAPISISSGYRCLALNRAIKSKDSSQHVLGMAADFEVAAHSNLEVASWIKDNLEFDQLILEFYKRGEPYSGWVHCSYRADGRNRKSILTISDTGTFPGLVG